ncbi:hypothetical protein BS47DRAFT_1385049 [Hydnum rufescens UP504]|uniref:Uncharacterized protein n=1 Tax=Hydnum rufescens UP504 TaxID=1448309 RepID=A0A9P6AL20_9AGAM|nr:hypothetical protein BS47DRAFT_1385049 [Hydnum rufescens UP504]
MGKGVPLPEPDDPSSVATVNTLRVGLDIGQGLSGNVPDAVWGWWVRRESMLSKPAVKEHVLRMGFYLGNAGFTGRARLNGQYHCFPNTTGSEGDTVSAKPNTTSGDLDQAVLVRPDIVYFTVEASRGYSCLGIKKTRHEQ